MIFSTVLIFVVLFFELLVSSAQGHDYAHIRKGTDNKFTLHILPGTKWCGNGDRATNYADLGYFRKTDICCRDHDTCFMKIDGHETRYGLTNPDSTTRSHCSCDQRFFDCLMASTTAMSHIVGEIYFNLLRKKCFRRKKCLLGEYCIDEYEWVEPNTWLRNN